jgi:hypothetical protein
MSLTTRTSKLFMETDGYFVYMTTPVTFKLQCHHHGHSAVGFLPLTISAVSQPFEREDMLSAVTSI